MEELLEAVTHEWFRELLRGVDERTTATEAYWDAVKSQDPEESQRAVRTSTELRLLKALTPEDIQMMVHRSRNGCWVWQKHVNSADGYGVITLDLIDFKAHRISYHLHVGAIPEGLELDHLCRNRACVNPKHLEPVTHQVNVRRGLSAGMVDYPHGWNTA